MDVYNLPSNKQKAFEFKDLVNQTNPWSAKDVYFYWQGDDLKIQLRSFDNAQNIQAELKGKMQTKNNGKCGLKAVTIFWECK